MKAKVTRNGEIVIVHLFGQINYETVDPFRETCLRAFQSGHIVFNLHHLHFVGSSGITPFVQTVEDLAQKNPQGLKLCGVRSEFLKVFASSDARGLEIYEDQPQAERACYGAHTPVLEPIASGPV